MKMNKKRLLQNTLFVGAIGISIFLLFFVVSCVWIGYEVKVRCRNAEQRYGGDCVESLIVLLDDERVDFRTRNSAIWALGQLGDSRALPVLGKYYTGIIPPKESLSKGISQYELKKAIHLASGNLNISAFIWRSTFFSE